MTEKTIPVCNQLLLYHGRTWTYRREEEGGVITPQVGTSEKNQVGIAIEYERVIENDVSLLAEFIQQVSSEQKRQFEQGLAKEAEEILDLPGNTIAVPKDASMVQAYLNFIKNSEPLVGPTGNPSRVQIILEPDAETRLNEELTQGGEEVLEEFKAQCELLWSEKEKHAVEKEAKRLAKYDQPE